MTSGEGVGLELDLLLLEFAIKIMTSKKKYLYILGYGRSGSTLLDRLLGSHPEILSVGEIGRFHNCLKERERMPTYCACGEKLFECQHWGAILKKLAEIDYCKLSFNDFNEFLLKEIFIIKPDANVIVDSSGNLPRLKALLNSELYREFEFKIVYLTRDARGVIYSASNRGYNNGEWKPSLLRATLSWRIRNEQFLYYFSFLSDLDKLHVTYEQLTDESEATIRNIISLIGLDYHNVFNDIGKIIHHTFAGNIGVRSASRFIIKSDRGWESGLSRSQKRIISLLTKKLNDTLMNRSL